MNIQIITYVTFSGPARDLTPLISDIVDAAVKNGYGVIEANDALTSLVVVKESDIKEFESSDEFAKSLVKDAISVVIPMKEDYVEN